MDLINAVDAIDAIELIGAIQLLGKRVDISHQHPAPGLIRHSPGAQEMEQRDIDLD